MEILRSIRAVLSFLSFVNSFQTPFQNVVSFPERLGARSIDIKTDLGPRLSSNASIFLPGSSQFADATLRWQEWRDPNITVVVEVATEGDVQETVSRLKLD
jgi:hypothetical protein